MRRHINLTSLLSILTPSDLFQGDTFGAELYDLNQAGAGFVINDCNFKARVLKISINEKKKRLIIVIDSSSQVKKDLNSVNLGELFEILGPDLITQACIFSTSYTNAAGLKIKLTFYDSLPVDIPEILDIPADSLLVSKLTITNTLDHKYKLNISLTKSFNNTDL